MSYKILVTDNLDKEGVSSLSQHPEFEVDVLATMSEEELIKTIPKYNSIIVRSATKVTAKIIEAAENLKVIARAGVGTDNIDKVAASAKGILVMNAPGGNTISTAEQTMALMLAVHRNLPWAHESTSSGKWEKKKFKGNQLYGKNVGVIGLGRIGMEVAIRCKAFGMRVLGYDPFLSEERAKSMGIETFNLDYIFRNADVITSHTPLTDKTKDLISKKEIELMKPDVVLINAARGGIYNEADVAQALKDGRIGGAAFDVYTKEPPENNPVIGAPKCINTCHLGASTAEAQVSVALETAEVVSDYFLKGNIRNSVNFPEVPVEVLQEARHFIDLSRNMGKMASCFVRGKLQEVKIGYKGQTAQKSLNILSRSALQGLLQPFLSEETSMISAPIIAKERGIQVSEYEFAKTTVYSDLFILEVKTDITTHKVIGTVLFGGEPRIININDYKVDFVPEGMFLIVKNKDVSGVVGKIGTILGNSKINIANMQLGRKEKGTNALTIIEVDNEVPESVLKDIEATDVVEETKVVIF